MNTRELPFPIAVLALVDGLSVATAMTSAYYLRIEGSVLPYSGPQNVGGYAVIAAFAIPLWIIIHFAARLYDPDLVGSGVEEYVQVLRASTSGVVVMVTLSFWDRSLLLSRGWVLISWVLSLAFLVLGRFLLNRLTLRARLDGRACARAIVVGTNHRAISISRQFNRTPSVGVRVVAFLDDTLPPGTVVVDGLPVWGSPSELTEAVERLRVSEVLVVSEALDWETFQDVLRQSSQFYGSVHVRICPLLDELISSAVRLGNKADIPVLTLAGLQMDVRAAFLKRATDCVVATALLLLLVPVSVVIAAVLRYSGSGSVLDRYTVIGIHGESFTALKFHTGLLGASRRSYGPSLAFPRDVASNTSSLGAFLYGTALDKLPQLWNVLKGEMSLVGPRTSTVGERALISNWLPVTSILRPGMTGPWAISNPTNIDQEMQGSLFYVRNWSFARDLIILCQTALSILKSGGTVAGGYIPTAPAVPAGNSFSTTLERATH